MRQSGMLAAAAIYALDHHIARLAQDHALAQRLGEGLAAIDGLSVEPVQSNIVFVDMHESLQSKAAGLMAYLKENGILATGLYRLRFVTHLDVDQAGIDRTIQVMRRYFQH
jgi:threonine aldolase